MPGARSQTQSESASRSNPCPLCDGIDGCSIGADGLLLCRRREGPQPGFDCLGPAKGDPQWTLYRLLNGNGRQRPEHGNGKPPVDWQANAEALAGNLTPALRDELAGALGLAVAVLAELPLLGYDPQARRQDDQGQWVLSPCWCFAEMDAAGRAVGILRRFRDGKKKAMAGGGRGLILPRGWQEGDGTLFVPEGPSDVLALRTLGRPRSAGPRTPGALTCWPNCCATCRPGGLSSCWGRWTPNPMALSRGAMGRSRRRASWPRS